MNYYPEPSQSVEYKYSDEIMPLTKKGATLPITAIAPLINNKLYC